jgi:hypothetical protein
MFLGLVMAGCGGEGPQTSTPSSTPSSRPSSTPSSTRPTLSEQQLQEVDLSAALFVLEDLPPGSRTLIANEDYVASTVPRLILCGEDVRRELNALTGRFAQFEGPPDVFLLVNHAVSGLPGDFAERLIDRLEDVGTACDQTWTGSGLNDRPTEFEVVGPFPLPDLLDQRLALEIAHRQEGQEEVRLFLVYVRTGQYLSAFTLLLDLGSDTGIVSDLAELAAEKLERAVLPG